MAPTNDNLFAEKGVTGKYAGYGIASELLKYMSQELITASYFPNTAQFIESHLLKYAEEFVERLEKYGVTEKDEPLKLSNWIKEFALLVGDLRIATVITTGNAQIGKTLINSLLLVDFLIFVGLNTIWFFPTKQQVDLIVPEQQQKILDYYLKNVERDLRNKLGTEINLRQKNDRQLTSRLQVKGNTAMFSYASTSGKDHTNTKKGLATAGGSATSVSASLLFIEERSQISPDAVAVLPRRLDASRLPLPYVREVGTPGSGLGIESAFDTASHHFYPSVTCPHCKENIFLSPKGCLLNEVNDGKYLSDFGRPINWFHYSKVDPIYSAYIGCSKCGSEIPDEVRFNATFRCLKTGTSLQEFRASLPQSVDDLVRLKQDSVIIHLSPLVKHTQYNLAASIISNGKNSHSVKDYQQQMLGYPSENDVFMVTHDMIKRAIKNKPPTTKPTFTIAGIDQGRHNDWITVKRFWVTGSYLNKQKNLRLDLKQMSLMEVYEQSFREIVVSQPIQRKDIKKMLLHYKCDRAFIDNEPDRAEVYALCKDTVMSPADQKGELTAVIKEIEVLGGSSVIPCFAVDNSFFNDAVLNTWTSKNLSCPDWNLGDKSPYSPVRHYTNHVKDPITNKWEKSSDGIDDLWFSDLFCEAAFFWHLYHKSENQHLNLDWYDAI